MDREYILNHVEELPAGELASAIFQYVVTMEELQQTHQLDFSKRQEIDRKLRELAEAEDEFWKRNQDSEQGLNDYVNTYSKGRYVSDANVKLKRISDEREEEEKRRKEIIDTVRTKPHSYTPGQIKGYLNDGIVQPEDLINAGVPERILKSLDNIIEHKLEIGATPVSIPEGFTEVYFWGIPGSGKTCALAGVLSTARQRGYLDLTPCLGFEYMTQLSNIFNTEVSFLPPSTAVDSTQYLPFVLRRGNSSPISVSLIELSGEVFKCFYYVNAQQNFPTESHKNTFESLMNFLNNSNRKIHFFFIDYSNEQQQGLKTQVDYLHSAATFFSNNDIIKNSTDAIYIVITKSDMMEGDEQEKLRKIQDYCNQNFPSFVNSVKAKCSRYSINGGRLLATHFSLGNVYFQRMCTFNSKTSENIIDILFRRIQPQKRTILDVLNQ